MSTMVENNQSRTAGGVNSERRTVYVKEAIIQTCEYLLIVYKGGIYSLTDPSTSRACGNTSSIEPGIS